MKPIPAFLLCFFLLFSVTVHADEAPWHTSLFFADGKIWKHRIPVDFENRGQSELAGFPVAVCLPKIGCTDDDYVRVVRADGQEVIFGTGWQLGQEKTYPDGSVGQPVQTVLFIPVDAKPGETTRYYVYTDGRMSHRRGFPLPEQEKLNFRAKIDNPRFNEGSSKYTPGTELEPYLWKFDTQDADHRLFWTDENSHKYGYCVKTVVTEGAPPSWISARQDRLAIRPGAKYRFSGYVRGENVNGISGWYIHVGPDGEPFTISPMAVTDEKTFDWKKVEVEFTSPRNAAVADIGTVLRGTGTAWFDDVNLEMLEDGDSAIAVTIHEAETCPLVIYTDNIMDQEITGMSNTAAAHNPPHPRGYECHSMFQVINDSDSEIVTPSVMFDLRGSFAHGRVGLPTEIIVQNSDRVITLYSGGGFSSGPTGEEIIRVPGTLIDPVHRQVMATIPTIPPRSINHIHVYYKFDEAENTTAGNGAQRSDRIAVETGLEVLSGHSAGAPFPTAVGTAHPELQKARDPYEGYANLVKNGGFEDSGAWEGESVLETDLKIVRFGKTCAKIEMTEKDAGTWRGFRQTIPVTGGRAYLVSAWLRCENMPGGARVHIHFHKKDGTFTASQSMTSLDREIRGTADWTQCSQVIVAPPDAAAMTIHLTANQPGTLWHDNVTVLDSILAEFVGVQSYFPPRRAGYPWQYPPNEEEAERYAKELYAWQVPAVMKVFPQTLPSQAVIDANNRGELVARISAARNEKEPLQIAVRIFDSQTVTVSEMKDADGNTLPAPEIACVGYVPVDYPSNYYQDTAPKWFRKSPRSSPGCDGWPGMWPDPLIPGNSLPWRRHNTGTNAFWITWSIPKDAAPGVYRGTISFTAVKDEMFSSLPRLERKIPDMPVEVTVYDFTLPDASGVSATYDARFTEPAGIWGDDAYSRGVETMAANRLEPDTIQPEPRISFRDGKVSFDWAEFDKSAAHLFDDLHVKYVYTPQMFYLFGWGHPPKDFYGEKPYDGVWPYDGADRCVLRPEYKARYQTALREFWNHVKEKGWAERFVLYISDEPNYWEEPVRRQMIALCEMIHEVDSAIPIYSSTWSYVPEWENSLDIWGIGHYGVVPHEKMREIRQRGDRIWFTTDGMMCLDTPYCAIERLLPHYCFKYDAEAYEFWGIGWLSYDPWKYGFHSYIRQSSTPGEFYYVRYPNGDGYLLYPDVPGDSDLWFEPGVSAGEGRMVTSIRFEQAREGVEDYEYLRMLRALIEANPDNEKTPAARAVLAEAMTLVECPTENGRYSTRILPEPAKLEAVREKVARAIESFR